MYAQRLTGCGQHRDTTPSVAIASELRGEGDERVNDVNTQYIQTGNGIGGGRCLRSV